MGVLVDGFYGHASARVEDRMKQSVMRLRQGIQSPAAAGKTSAIHRRPQFTDTHHELMALALPTGRGKP